VRKAVVPYTAQIMAACSRRPWLFPSNVVIGDRIYEARICATGFSCKSSSVACTRRSE
jgi:hypothetical protein